nr:uncharacterized protein LOC110283330 [Parasteatoda tepidariorum]
MDSFASFMGHDIGIHREFYRLPNDIIQIAKTSKLLLFLDQGNLHKEGGQTLDEIQFSLDNDSEEDDDYFLGKKFEEKNKDVEVRNSSCHVPYLPQIGQKNEGLNIFKVLKRLIIYIRIFSLFEF